MSNNNSRTRLILQLAKQASARYDDEWEVRLDRANMHSTSSDILISEEIQDNRKGCHNGQQTPLSVIEAEPQPALCSYDTIVESSEAVQFLVDTHSENNQSSSRVTEDSVAEDLSLSDPYTTDDSMGDPDYSDDTSETSSDEAPSLVNRPTTSCDRKSVDERAHDIQVEKRKMLNAPKGEKKGKKRIANPQNWIKNEAKRLRNTGNSYLSTSKGKKVISARTLLPPCNDKCILKCYSKFTEEDRKQIFKEYWGLGDLEKQRQYISASMTVVKPKYR
nr:unnamed protein product [Callosobruchus chinensis]